MYPSTSSAHCYLVRCHVLCKHALEIGWACELVLYANFVTDFFFLKSELLYHRILTYSSTSLSSVMRGS